MKLDSLKPLNCTGMNDSDAIAHTVSEFRKLQRIIISLNADVEALKQKVMELESTSRRD